MKEKWLCGPHFLEEGSQTPNTTLFLHLHYMALLTTFLAKNSMKMLFSIKKIKVLISYNFLEECRPHRHPFRAACLRYLRFKLKLGEN